MMDSHRVADTVLCQLGVKALKAEQEIILKHLMNGKDVFAILPTGFGKSLPYQIFPLQKQMQSRSATHPLVLIVSPLVALMKDQIQKLTLFGLKAAIMTDTTLNAMEAEDKMFLFGSPENFLQSGDSLQRLSEMLKSRVCLLVVDEVHTIPKWGEASEKRRHWKPKEKEAAFRKFFSHVGEIRSFFPSIPLLALTATATLKTQNYIMESLAMVGCQVVEKVPDRPNLRYSVIKISRDVATTFYWLADMLRELTVDFPRTVFYCFSIDHVTRLYTFLKRECPDLIHLFGMHHSETDEEIQDQQLCAVSSEESQFRIIFSTSALGMGIDMKQVYHVVHYGPPVDIESYVQETGRAGRDNKLSHAILLYNGQMTKDSPDFKHYINDVTLCRRVQLMSKFTTDFKSSLKHDCCDNCAQKCHCGKCGSSVSFFEKVMKCQDKVSQHVDSEESELSSDSSLESDADVKQTSSDQLSGSASESDED